MNQRVHHRASSVNDLIAVGHEKKLTQARIDIPRDKLDFIEMSLGHRDESRANGVNSREVGEEDAGETENSEGEHEFNR